MNDVRCIYRVNSVQITSWQQQFCKRVEYDKSGAENVKSYVQRAEEERQKRQKKIAATICA